MPICVPLGNARPAFRQLHFAFFEVGSSWLTWVVTHAHKVRDDQRGGRAAPPPRRLVEGLTSSSPPPAAARPRAPA